MTLTLVVNRGTHAALVSCVERSYAAINVGKGKESRAAIMLRSSIQACIRRGIDRVCWM